MPTSLWLDCGIAAFRGLPRLSPTPKPENRRNPSMRAEPTGRKSPLGRDILTDGTIDYSFHGPVRLNRSQKWEPASTYQEARDKSPSTEPVR